MVLPFGGKFSACISPQECAYHSLEIGELEWYYQSHEIGELNGITIQGKIQSRYLSQEWHTIR